MLDFVIERADQTQMQTRIPENWVVHILRQLIEGLHVLHSLGFVHLDLSLENAMCDTATGTKPRASDFVVVSAPVVVVSKLIASTHCIRGCPGRVRIIDMGFLTRIPRDPATGEARPFPPRKLRHSGKIMACAPELFQVCDDVPP